MEYRDVVLYYQPNIDIRLLDRHFSKVFGYTKVEEKELLVIKEKGILDRNKEDGPEDEEVVQNLVIPEEGKRDRLEVSEVAPITDDVVA